MAISELHLYNALTGKKECFESLYAQAGHKPKKKDGSFSRGPVGMYVCGPTVYQDVHLGNVRTFLTFDVLYRYLRHLGYEVRYVRNMTDVGHMSEEVSDSGEDKIEKAARLEKKEPMEVAQHYIRRFHKVMEAFHIVPPNLEPQATAHIPEQIEFIDALLKEGYAYEAEGNVYFDLDKYRQKHEYGRLSGRKVDELYAGTRALVGEGKKNPLDFALWKKAEKGRLMWWNSPWGKGVPGWHLECSAMSQRYLGKTFDIHGGGMDLKFPHHECERAQCIGINGKNASAKYWLYSNMLTVEGKKMSKSLGNVVDVWPFFDPKSRKTQESLKYFSNKPFAAPALRLLMLQSHYRSVLDFSYKNFEVAYSTYINLRLAIKIVEEAEDAILVGPVGEHDSPKELLPLVDDLKKLYSEFETGMNDDLNTPKALAALMAMAKRIHPLRDIHLHIGHPKEFGKQVNQALRDYYLTPFRYLLGQDEGMEIIESAHKEHCDAIEKLIMRYHSAKIEKDYGKVDYLREIFKSMGIEVRDGKNSFEWRYQTATIYHIGALPLNMHQPHAPTPSPERSS